MVAIQSGTGITGVGIGVVSTASIPCHLVLSSAILRVHSGAQPLPSRSWGDGLGVLARVWYELRSTILGEAKQLNRVPT